jgi:hypothetical protein
MKKLLCGLMALVCATLAVPALAATQTCATKDLAGNCIPGQVLIDPSTGLPYAASGGGGGGGSLSAKANASVQTSTEGATTDPLSMDLSRNLRVIDSLVAGKLDTMIAGLSDTSPSFVKIDHTTPGTTDAVVVTSSALPTGGATAAKQPALGTAGTAATDVITVQGIAGGVAQPVSGTFWQATQPVSGTFWQATQPVSGTFWQATQPVSLASVPLGTNAAQETGGNLAGIATSASSIATNTALVASGATDSGGSIKPGCVFLTTMPTVTNTQRVDQQCTNHGEHIVAIGGASIQAAVTNISSDAQIGPNALATRSFGAIFNGAGSGWDRLKKPNLSCRIISSAATTNLTTCKASGATDVFGYEAYNTTATIKVLKFYNKGSSPTVGTDTPTVTIVLPPTSRASFTWPSPLYSSLGLYIALTGATADNDTTALASGDVVGVNVYIQ